MEWKILINEHFTKNARGALGAKQLQEFGRDFLRQHGHGATEKAPMPLHEALDLVNRVLRNEQVSVRLSTQAAAQALADGFVQLGLLASNDGDSASNDVPMNVKTARR